jgi:hypothetical protein
MTHNAYSTRKLSKLRRFISISADFDFPDIATGLPFSGHYKGGKSPRKKYNIFVNFIILRHCGNSRTNRNVAIGSAPYWLVVV